MHVKSTCMLPFASQRPKHVKISHHVSHSTGGGGHLRPIISAPTSSHHPSLPFNLNLHHTVRSHNMSTQEPDASLHLPRLLCLHGGGVSASVFRLQMRAVYAQLRDKFRLVYADGPWLCEAGPGILPVFEGAGPFRVSLRGWSRGHECL